jgi:FGGY-family pentulose kinase
MAEGGQSATGQLLKHVIETHAAYNTACTEVRGLGTNIFHFLNEHLAGMQQRASAPSLSHLARHFFFYGDLFGNRSPIADPSMTGSVVGLTADTSLDSLAIHYYGVMEFIALQTRQIISKMNAAGHGIETVFMSGSQSQNETLMSLISTACNMPVVTPHYVTAAVCHGAAMLGVRAATADRNGEAEDLWSIMKRMTRPGNPIYPISCPAVVQLLDVKYTIFLEQCERQREFRKMVDAVVA